MSSIRFVAPALLVLASPTVAQQAPPAVQDPPTARTEPQPSAEPGDIVVKGYREQKPKDTRTQVPTATSTIENRRTYDYSERLAKCAARSRLSNLSRLRGVVDGEVNSATHRMAQDRLVRTYITCGESPQLLTFNGPPRTRADLGRTFVNQIAGGDPTMIGDLTGFSGLTEAAPLGASIYDRGAFTIAVLKQFVPDLKLTRAQTGDPAVQSRFNLREVPRNRLRLPADYKYFQTAVCMVRLQPGLAVRLALSQGAARLGDVQEALIDRARVCVGNARDVKVDPTQFRLYIADAVYRWAVAARNVASLIPSDKELAAAK